MPSTTYVARRPGPFADLVQAAQIGGLRLHPLPPVRVRDRFYDTQDGALLHRGLALRVRDQDGSRTAALRSLTDSRGRGSLPDDVAMSPAEGGRLDLPPGPFAEFVRAIVDGERLRVLLALRQYRTPRVALDGERPVALLSFDVVVYEVPGAQVVSNEVEIEPMGEASSPDTSRLDAAFRERGLEAAAESKFERGVLRLPRSLSEPALVLPRERELLEAAVASGPPLLRRRARVVLLDARGFRPDTIAAQTGLSMARVRHWRQRFREVRMGILEGESCGVPDPVAPLRAVPPVPDKADACDASAVTSSSVSPLSSPPPPLLSPLPPRPSASESGASSGVPPRSPLVEGDGLSGGAPEDPTQTRDMAALLELFTPTETATPLLDGGPITDEELDLDEDAPLDDDFDQDSGSALPSVAAPPIPAPSVAYPVVLGPFARTVPSAPSKRSAPAERPAPDPTSRRPDPNVRLDQRPVQEAAADPSREPPRRPVLSGETSLLYAAQATIAYHVAAFEAALGRLTAGRSDADARRLLIACHRVRLSVDSFRMVLPERAAARLLAALRPLVADLDSGLDAGRAAAADGTAQAVLSGRRARALESAIRRLREGRQQAWGDRARRLLRRLDEQRADGLLLGDDFPLPPDDFVGEPGDLPTPSRLRHVVGSMLWVRYEALRAFEDEMEGDVDPEVAYHLAIAVSGLHFVLGLAAKASTGPVRDVATILDDAEQRIAGYRHQHRTAELVRDQGGERLPVPDAAVVIATWRSLLAPPFREQLAAVVAQV